MRAAVTCLVLALALPTHGLAQGKKVNSTLVQAEDQGAEEMIYSWVDGRGAWHFVDSLALVPAGYTSQARANATRARRGNMARGKTASSTPVTPPVKREELATEKPPTDGERTARVRHLQRRLVELEAEIAALEEGNVPETYLKAAGSEDALTNEKLDELLTRTELEIGEVQTELSTLDSD
jgi:hypothetical protein